uniref:Uncharacterized protein n=1 Tax=Chromera velia CCMP2878 TaxID=1169474 RepID=A0A0G4GTV3_9ALVE|eukprot:Cvel_5204.t1-p1 / transcript=Cvel_5204.t1 / gene=Cvel_5204 / organism=Chromera_velia_CCMP2878 / gene_product=hypothetical protein / transcript_product=hypothetical protein / location=Cvel_scaffold239:62026-63250(+) / protein_length=90 / sequence_SO=supercontig / SO=protein_coding / is_pseudo=false
MDAFASRFFGREILGDLGVWCAVGLLMLGSVGGALSYNPVMIRKKVQKEIEQKIAELPEEEQQEEWEALVQDFLGGAPLFYCQEPMVLLG